MQIIFTRHGESEANVTRIISNRNLPHHLTKQGQNQAQILLEKLALNNIVAIYSSPIPRAQQTAQIIAKKWHLPIHLTDALREFDCGIMEGRSDEETWQAHHAVIQAWDEQQDYAQHIKGGESFNDLQARFVPFVEQLIREFSAREGDILLVSHGSLLHQMLPLVLTNVDRPFSQEHPLANCAYVVATQVKGKLTGILWDGLNL